MSESGAGPSDIHHMVPEGAAQEVELSIVVPALNEEITVGEFVDWCKEGLKRINLRGQILIVDSSSDDTAKFALQHGAEVLLTKKRGLGRAYIDAIPYIRGEWILMGDADLTYDFRELSPFVEAFRNGAEFIMGSRFRGAIEKGAMPSLHRYFGTPITTWIVNRIYHSNYSDIHCGMRGLTRSALKTMDIKSQSWEYASEMVLKSARLGLATAEVPVKFYKDRAGRLSHHRRAGWLSPWRAGWLNLKVTLVYTPDSFLLKPGMLLTLLGVLLSLALARGPITVAHVGLGLYWMLLGVTCATLGYSCIQIGLLARVMHGLRPGFLDRLRSIFTYDRGMVISGALILVGIALLATLVYHYVKHGLRLEALSHPAILGLLLVILGFQTFCFTLLVEMVRRLAPKENE